MPLSHHHRCPGCGILLMLGFGAIMPVCDAIAKAMSADYSLLQVTWGRYAFHFVTMLVVLTIFKQARIGGITQPVRQLWRGLLLVGSTLLFFAALSGMPLADALALMYVFPIVLTVLSPWLLCERVGYARWLAVAVGFVGVVCALRPGTGTIGLEAWLALASGLALALYFIVTRQLAGTDPPLKTLTLTALVGTVVMSLSLPWIWVAPTPADFALMVVMGASAAIGHTFSILAFDHAEASLLSPFAYSELIFAAGVGYVAFGDFPDGWVWSGIAIITLSGILLSLQERRERTTTPI